MTADTHRARATYDVLVVGAGPAGLTTAASLARYGLRVLVVERHAATTIFPRATGVSTRTMEVMRSWGLEERVREGAMPLQPFVSMSRTLADPVDATMPVGFAAPELAASVSATTACFCPQDHLEPVLLEHVLAHGGQVRFRTELADFAMDDDGVTAWLHDRAEERGGLATYAVRARFLVGADGPRSPVRTGLGIGVEDLGTLGEWVSVLFRADLSDVVADRYLIHGVGSREAPTLFVPTSNDDRWQYGFPWHPERGESLEDLTPRRCIELIRAAAGAPDLQPEVLAVLPFTMAGTVATAFRAGNGFLVGDAAHRMTPRGGRGLNSGVGDGHNLGWKLAWVLRGWADEALLDSYEPERRPIGIANTLNSLDTTQRDPATVLADALAADLGVVYRSAVVTDDGSTGAGSDNEVSLTARPGGRSPHLWVLQAGQRRSTLDLFDGRLSVLTGRGGHRWRRATAELAATGLPLAAFTVGRDLQDVDGVFAERYEIGAGGAVLVRPDGHVAWRRARAAADPREDLAAAVATALGRPPAVAPVVEDAG